MSLLPGTVLPPAMPLGRVQVNKDGQAEFVMIEMNWWLFLYNLSQNVLGTPGGGQSTGLSATALIEIASLEADADDADAIAARVFAQSIAVLAQETVADADVAQLRTEVRTALSLAQEALLADPVIFPPGAQPANPAAKVGTTPVNGTAATFMRSDAAPPIDLTMSYSWTGAHAFSQTIVATAGAQYANAAVLSWKDTGGTSRTVLQMFSDNNVYLDSPVANGTVNIRTNAASKTFAFGGTGNLSIPAALGVNGATPPAQVTGWGTPTGAAVVANFNGASGTLVNCSNAIAEIITILKQYGLIGA